MSYRRMFWILLIFWGWVSVYPEQASAYLPPGQPSLAEHVPGDVQLYVELRDTKGLSKTPVGAALMSMLTDVLAGSTIAAQTQPAGDRYWQELAAKTLGLPVAEIADLLFTGRLAIAAEDWNKIGDAVLIVKPDDPLALERKCKVIRVKETDDKPVRRYRLAHQHELACNGKIVVVGMRSKRLNLYARTIRLLTDQRGIMLNDLADFRERMSALPVKSQIVIYASTGRASPTQKGLNIQLWPAHWPHLLSVAIGFTTTASGATVDTNGRLHPAGPKLSISDPLIPTLLLLPTSAALAWTHTIDYVSEFKRLNQAYPNGFVRFYIDLLQYRLPPQALERDLFSHLIGDTIFMVGKVDKPIMLTEKRDLPLLLPVAVMIIETDDPESVEKIMNQIARNFVRLFATQQNEEMKNPIQTESLGEAGGTVYTIDIGKLLWSKSNSDLLKALEISWTVADNLLVVGTHSQMVRQVIQACRGQYPWIPDNTLLDVIQSVHNGGNVPSILLVAQPTLVGEMIDSWLNYAARNHPQIYDSKWWQELRSQQRASGVQLGILPDRRHQQKGVVRVARTLPKKPAHNRLKPGDQIISVDGQKLDPEKTLASLRMFLADRKRPDRVTLGIIRGQKEKKIAIPMPDETSTVDHIQPIRLLKQTSEFLQMFSSASHVIWQPSPELVSTRLKLQFKSQAVSGGRKGKSP
ncbi:MAG: PDZ domain-containing protein [Planctomycetota bacterium]